MDIYVANDAMENNYFENNGKGHFIDKALRDRAGLRRERAGRLVDGPAVGDVDRDGQLDIFVPDMGYRPCSSKQGEFYPDLSTARASPSLRPVHRLGRRALRLRQRRLPGRVHRQRRPAPRVHARRPSSPATTARASSSTWRAQSGEYFKKKYVGRGAAFADFDNDGDIDMLVMDTQRPPHLLRNDGGNRQQLAQGRRRARTGKRAALGARVTVEAGRPDADPGRHRRQRLSVAERPAAALRPGQGRRRPTWSSPLAGRQQKRVENVKANQILEVVQGEEVGGMRHAPRRAPSMTRRSRWRRLAAAPAALRAQAAKHPVFVGAQACAQCHDGKARATSSALAADGARPKAYASLATPEAKADRRLSGIPEEPQKAPICLGCHATAAEAETGRRTSLPHSKTACSARSAMARAASTWTRR